MIHIAAWRLHSQRLTGEPFPEAVAAVRWFGAVQSQDYSGAKWAIGQRAVGVSDAGLDRLFDRGAIVRTHVMRPTWHFVLPEDLRWLIRLTGPRVRRGLAGRYRQLEIDEGVAARAGAVFTAALADGTHLTRNELGAALNAAGISPEGQRLPHLIMAAELEGLITSGPRRGKQFTYALLEERAPSVRALERTEALIELTRRYFRSHGPAQIQDFVWWSGLTMAEARSGIALCAKELERLDAGGKDYWFDAEAGPLPASPLAAHLLPNFDEFIVAYRDRAAVVDPDRPYDSRLFTFGSILSNVVTIAGRVRGAWRRIATGQGLRVDIRLLGRLNPAEAAAVEDAGRRLGRFLERSVEVVCSQ